jgi:tetratricopeptide (TPR) repeat protein
VVITLENPFSVSTATALPATATPNPPPVAYRLEGIKFHQQGWNNCGPANLAMGLSYFDWEGDQYDTASFLKPEREDRNVTPAQMVEYVNRFTNLKAIWRMAGTTEQIRWLLANEFVVIVESGYDPGNGEGWYGHYETVVGYDDTRGMVTVYDSYLGRSSNPSLTRSWDLFDKDWQAFNRNYIVIYPEYREPELRAFLGSDWLEQSNRRKAVEIAQKEANADPQNAYAWFNFGTSLTSIGRYEEAVAAFSRAFELGKLSYRMLWYQFAPYEALLQTGRLDEVLDLVNETLQTSGGRYVEEGYYYRGRVFEVRGEYTDAVEEYSRALELNPNYSQAQAALSRVEGLQ